MYRIIGLLLPILLLLSGCNLVGPVNDLLKPPNLTEDQRALNDALISATGFPDVRLKYPQRGEYLSAFIHYDPYLGDRREENVVVFYGLGNSGTPEDDELMVAVLSKNEDGYWAVSGQLPTPDRDLRNIDFVRFLPFEDPEVNNILVGWSSARGDRNKLAVYRFTGGDLEVVYEAEYSECINTDVDGDGLHELFIITSSSQVQMIRKEPHDIARFSIENLSPMDSYRQVTYGMLTESLGALFIDYYTSTSSGLLLDTRVITVDTDRLVSSPLSELDPEEWGIANTFLRPIDAALCEDIDNNGTMDIPAVSPLPGYSGDEVTGSMWLTYYIGVIEGGGFRTVKQAIVNMQSAYMFELPTHWRDATAPRVTVHADAFVDEWSFYMDRGSLEESFSEAPLLCIRVVSEQDDPGDLEEQGYFDLPGKSLFRYYALIPEGSEITNLDISQEDVLAHFRLR